MFLRTIRSLRWQTILLCTTTVLFCMFAVLYGFSQKENRLLVAMQQEKNRVMAQEETMAAIEAWKTKAPVPVLYHYICSAAEHLAMTTPSPENTAIVEEMLQAGQLILQGEEEQDVDLMLTEISNVVLGRHGISDEENVWEVSANSSAAWVPWEGQPVISREEGISKAEMITDAAKILHAAEGTSYVYTCKNVYMKLSEEGGIPLEGAFFPYPLEDPVSTPASKQSMCMKTILFLEKALPHRLFRRAGAVPQTMEGEEGYTVMYTIGKTHIASMTMWDSNWMFRMLPKRMDT